MYPQNFFEGERVRIANRTVLENFISTWLYHNKLEPIQLEFGGQSAAVKEVGFYHGGDVLYTLHGVPGIWHEQLLEKSL